MVKFDPSPLVVDRRNKFCSGQVFVDEFRTKEMAVQISTIYSVDIELPIAKSQNVERRMIPASAQLATTRPVLLQLWTFFLLPGHILLYVSLYQCVFSIFKSVLLEPDRMHLG